MTAAEIGQQLKGERDAAGRFVRQPNAFRDVVTADGSSGFPAEPGRYHLYVSLACPWAHRSIITRRLLGLEDAIGMTVVDPVRDERGWAFTEEYPDPVNGFHFLGEAYLASDPAFRGRYTVPTLWDRAAGRILSNDFPDLALQLGQAFLSQAKHPIDLYPPELREEIDAVKAVVFDEVNNGVYKAGFATSQAIYDDAVTALFARLDWLEERLAGRRYLVGGQLTEADVCLFPTLVRFDAVYHGHFKCNLRRLVDYPNLWAYARDLYQRPGFGETVDFDHIKRHYYLTHPHLDPTGIVPKGPIVDWDAPHGRERLP
ncbi:MAG TPA: glutathione S-transferase family protein [Thermomicrobiales bacterium]|nr:glutathione S-transferase family protein [Thermomicrobiales bacterium]